MLLFKKAHRNVFCLKESTSFEDLYCCRILGLNTFKREFPDCFNSVIVFVLTRAFTTVLKQNTTFCLEHTQVVVERYLYTVDIGMCKVTASGIQPSSAIISWA